MFDLKLSDGMKGKKRRDWGLQNMMALPPSNPALDRPEHNGQRQHNVARKVETFIARGIFPQQLTIPRQYATTEEGVFVRQILKGREIDGVVEDGVRVVVQENAMRARFIMSPLFGHEQDALAWAVNQTAARTL